MNWAALAPLIVLSIGFVVFCIVDIVRHDVRHLPKAAWIVICCVSIPLGGIVYLLVGRGSGDTD